MDRKNKKSPFVLITGAGGGIGRALSIVAIKNGYDVILWSLHEEELLETQKLCLSTDSNRKVQIFQVDVSQRERCAQVAHEILEKWGTPQMVFANAGLGGINPAQSFDLNVNEKLMQVNYFGTANCFVPFIDSMKNRGSGHLVGVSSLAAFRGMPQAASYCASKAAQAILCESFRVDLKKFGIRVTVAHPGFVKTAMANHDEFKMPFMVSAQRCAEIIWYASVKGKSQVLFPLPMRVLTMVNRILPNWVFDWMIPRLNPTSTRSKAKVFGQ